EHDRVDAHRGHEGAVDEPPEGLLGDAGEPAARVRESERLALAEPAAVAGDGGLPERAQLGLAAAVEVARRRRQGAGVARAPHVATAGKARRKRSKRAGSARPRSAWSSTGAPTVIEKVRPSPGKMASFTHPRSPATSPVVPRGPRPRRRR